MFRCDFKKVSRQNLAYLTRSMKNAKMFAQKIQEITTWTIDIYFNIE